MTAEDKYRMALEEALLQMGYNPNRDAIPDWLNKVVASILDKYGLEIAVNDPEELLGIKIKRI